MLLPAGTASASGLPAAQTRVGAINPTVTTVVGVAEHIAAGQRRVRAPSQLQFVSGHCVAAEGRVAAMDSFSESGATISHSSTATAIGDDANTMTNFGRSRGAAGHDVIVHGDEAGNFRVNGDITNPNQIADAIRGNPNSGGGPINLVTCHGACGAAQELQGIMGVPVNASPFRVDLDPWSGFLREFR